MTNLSKRLIKLNCLKSINIHIIHSDLDNFID